MKAKSAPPARYPRVWRWIVCIFTIHTIQSTHPKLSTPKIPIQNFKSTRFLFSFFRIRAGFGTSGHSLGPFEDRENDDKSDVDFDFDFSGSSVAEALKHYQDHTRRTSRAASLRFDGDESNESNERDDRNSGTPSRRNNAGGRMRGRSAKARASSRRGYREHGHRIRGQSHILGSSGRGVGGVAAGTGGGDTSKNDHTRRFKDMLKMRMMRHGIKPDSNSDDFSALEKAAEEDTREYKPAKFPKRERSYQEIFSERYHKFAQDFQLSRGQLQVLSIVENGQSVFFTGNAGTGKSALLKVIINLLRNSTDYKPNRRNAALHVTASTGTAAAHIGGTTLHSFASIGLGTDPLVRIVTNIRNNKRSMWRWESCRTLIIDEISMVPDTLFDKIEAVAREIRGDDRPFGGIQLILSGDFLQLPPVTKGRPGGFAFLAESWNRCVPRAILLTEVFRQSDPVFAGALNELRLGLISNQTKALFNAANNRTLPKLNGIEPTRLYVHNIEVDRINSLKLDKLQSQPMRFEAIDGGNEPFRSIMHKNSPTQQTLSLKMGAQVLLLKNLDVPIGLVNGARGVVVRFEKYDHDEEEGKTRYTEMSGRVFPVVRFAPRLVNGSLHSEERIILAENFTLDINGKPQAWRHQVPLKLAWAISIHKSQGMTIDHLEVDMKGCFAYGQAYVALSRARSFEGLRLLNFRPEMVRAAPKAVEFYEGLRNTSNPNGNDDSIFLEDDPFNEPGKVVGPLDLSDEEERRNEHMRAMVEVAKKGKKIREVTMVQNIAKDIRKEARDMGKKRIKMLEEEEFLRQKLDEGPHYPSIFGVQ